MLHANLFVFVTSETPEYLLKKMQQKNINPAFFFWHGNVSWIKKHLTVLKSWQSLIFVQNSLSGVTKKQFSEFLSFVSFAPKVFQIAKSKEKIKTLSDFLKNPFVLKLSTKICLQKKRTKEFAVLGSVLDSKDFLTKKMPVAESLLFKKSNLCFVNIDRTTPKNKCPLSVENIVVFSNSEKKLSEFIEKN